MFRIIALFTMTALAACGSARNDRAAQENPKTDEGAAAASPQLKPYNPAVIPGMARIEDKSYVLKSAIWKNVNIPVCWENASSAEPDRQLVRTAIERTWQANSGLRFFGWGTCAANAQGIRIAVSDEGPHTKGLGNQLNAKKQGMVLNFTFRNWSTPCAAPETQRQSCISSIAVHEFGHAVGFAHEQNRPDTPGECTEKPQGSNGDLMLTPWDPQSVMNYCNPVYNNDGKLSALDLQTLKAIYP